MATTTFEKQGLVNGIGNLFLEMMLTEDSSVNEPTYSGEVYETASIDTAQITFEINEKQVFLSDLEHSDLTKVTAVNVPINAGYFPAGFAEEAQGMLEDGVGGWFMPDTPKKKPFRMSFPAKTENDDEIIYSFPKCTLSPVEGNFQTRNTDTTEQIPTFNVRSVPLLYKTTGEARRVYNKQSLVTPEEQSAWDRNKLLTQGWYNAATKELCKVDLVEEGV